MRIQHNIAALNSHRQLTNNNSAVSKNLEKLSSGYKINRAGDDAAGLAISEKMRAQITGLNTASKNAQDGISLVQTAEGALTEVHSMLNRMTELADQSANGTYQDLVDRENIQKELNSLRSEIDRISEGTNFNGINLLDGSLGGASISAIAGTAASGGAAATQGTLGVDITNLVNGGLAAGGMISIGDIDIQGPPTSATAEIDLATVLGAGGIANGTNFTIGSGVDKIEVAGLTGSTDSANGALAAIQAKLGTGTEVTLDGVKYNATLDGTKLKLTASVAGASTPVAANIAGEITNDSTAVQVGDVTSTTAGVAHGAMTEADTLTAISTAIAGQDITIDGNIYTGTLNGKKLELTVKTAGLTTQNQANIIADITGNAALVAGDLTITDGKAIVPPTNPATAGTTKVSFSNLPKAGDTITVDGTVYEFVKAGETAKGNGNKAVTIGADTKDTATNFHTELAANGSTASVVGSTVTISAAQNADGTNNTTAPVVKQMAQGLTLQIGESSQSFNQLNVAVGSMSTKALGIDTADVDVSSQENAKLAVQKIKDAINTVSSTRGDLGAIQNRLEHTINNLGVTAENMTAAESRIRDVDMAQEMMNFTKNNILTQASQSMLAQANQLPQGVLQLLQ